MIHIACPACKATLQVADDQVGQKVACASCGQRLLVPTPVLPEAAFRIPLPPPPAPTQPEPDPQPQAAAEPWWKTPPPHPAKPACSTPPPAPRTPPGKVRFRCLACGATGSVKGRRPDQTSACPRCGSALTENGSAGRRQNLIPVP